MVHPNIGKPERRSHLSHQEFSRLAIRANQQLVLKEHSQALEKSTESGLR
ncbi:hypothetical protein ACPOL_6517 [Acidisarcina polymorpha]|uniref:Uncharacterized protein n=1 Tax=Acidisarcina polymorpha TaxID=2211140 RepID=A0A2Z5G9P0_9BACT|nr:hypothetical protein ACPOL_6517 [Acidisarcina polymorpha]